MPTKRGNLSLDRNQLGRDVTDILKPRLQRLGRRIVANARQKAPVKTGNLRRSIGSRVRVTNKRVTLDIFARAKYAAYVHDGTKPHIIRPRKPGGVLAFPMGGRTVFATYSRHPGTRAREFLKNAIAEEVRRP